MRSLAEWARRWKDSECPECHTVWDCQHSAYLERLFKKQDERKVRNA